MTVSITIGAYDFGPERANIIGGASPTYYDFAYDQYRGAYEADVTSDADAAVLTTLSIETTYQPFVNNVSPGIAGQAFGIMDPTIALGETLSISDYDLLVFDAIGWDIVAVPEPSTETTALAGLACEGLWMWRRRNRLPQMKGRFVEPRNAVGSR